MRLAQVVKRFRLLEQFLVVTGFTTDEGIQFRKRAAGHVSVTDIDASHTPVSARVGAAPGEV
jgi:hypothetical protein